MLTAAAPALNCTLRTRLGYRRYSLSLAIFLVLPTLLLAAFVVAIDPYYVFGSPSWAGINKARPAYAAHVLAAKPYQVRRLRPAAVALGSSRAEVGLDPRHPGWIDAPAFNFSLPGTGIYFLMQAFLHAQDTGRPLRQAVVGLDFFAFNIFFPIGAPLRENRFAGSGAGARAFANFFVTESKSPVGGRREPIFHSTRWNEALYLALNPDVAAAIARGEFKTGAEHWELWGRVEGRVGSAIPPNWNEAEYLAINEDVAAEVERGTFLNGYHHYMAAGRRERRVGGFFSRPRPIAPAAPWSEALYLAVNPDVAAAIAGGEFKSGYEHWKLWGRAEKRVGNAVSPDWNEAEYLAINPDVAAEVKRGTFLNGYHHFIAAGRAEHREGGLLSEGWDEWGYLHINRDVQQAIERGDFVTGFHHYVVAGREEGRDGGFLPANWDEKKYLTENPIARIRVALGDYPSGYVYRKLVGNERDGYPRLKELFGFILSADATRDTVATILRQAEPATLDDRGMRVWKGHDAEMKKLGGTGGFIRARIPSGAWGPLLTSPALMFCFTNSASGMTTFDPFRFMLRRAYAGGTDLRMFVAPVPIVARVLYKALGVAERYDFWLAELTRINEDEAERAGRQPFPLWDFSDANTITQETIPDDGDVTPMRWFWEDSHYRKEAGDLILDRVLDHREPSRSVPPDFGVRLTGATVEAHVAKANEGLDAWAGTNPELAESILQSPALSTHSYQPWANCW